jgi:hypothetical protein
MPITSTIFDAEIFAEVNPEVADIKAKTDNLPSDPADESLLEAAITAAATAIRGVDNDTLKTLSDQIDSITPAVTSKTKSTYTYTNAGGEQTIFTIVTATIKTVQGVWLDLSNITQKGTIRSYYKIDGVVYVLINASLFDPALDTPGFFINLNMGITDDFKVTYQEDTDEGADRAIPYAAIFNVNE